MGRRAGNQSADRVAHWLPWPGVLPGRWADNPSAWTLDELWDEHDGPGFGVVSGTSGIVGVVLGRELSKAAMITEWGTIRFWVYEIDLPCGAVLCPGTWGRFWGWSARCRPQAA